MASQIIPKEHFSTYHHWEMDAFEPTPGRRSESALGKEDTSGPAAVILPTVEQIERIHQQAQEEGYAAGYEAGIKAGHEFGLKAGKEHAMADAKIAGVAP